MTPNLTRKKAFTLIELLTVIAIIGILAGLLVPGVIIAKRIANKTTAANNCTQIAKAYSMHAGNGTTPRNISITNVTNAGGGVTGWAVFLASKTGMNNADMWFIKQDKALDNVQNYPQQVADLVGNPNQPTAQSDFATASPKSWAVVVNAAKNADATTYPIIWTRGLSGTAWTVNSPWGTEGGHIGFMDGHVVAAENTTGDQGTGILTNQLTGRPTSDINQAITATANATSAILEDK